MTTVERIDAILKKRNISRRQFAISAQIPPSSLQSAMERNKPLSFEMQQKISNALGVSVYEVLGDDERALFVEAEAGTIGEYFKQGYQFTDGERVLVKLFNTMNDQGQDRALDHVLELSQVPRYKATPPPQSAQMPKGDVETAQQSPAEPQEGTDTAPAPEGSEGTQKPSEDKK